MGRKKRGKDGPCVYCGEVEKLTEDHVFPKCLFDEPLPPNMPKVPACKNCNGIQKSRNDSFLRDMLAQDSATILNPVAQRLVSGPVKRAIQRNQSECARSISSIPIAKPLFDHHGNFVDYLGVHPLDNKRIDAIFTFIAKGLYYHVFGKIIPPYIKIRAKRLEIHEVHHRLLPMLDRAGPLNSAGDKMIKLGRSVTYSYLRSNPPWFHINSWILTFFESIFYVVVFNQPRLVFRQRGEGEGDSTESART
jgi:hypothetical protein